MRGKIRKMSKQCPKCGTPAPDYHNFCGHCEFDFSREGDAATTGTQETFDGDATANTVDDPERTGPAGISSTSAPRTPQSPHLPVDEPQATLPVTDGGEPLFCSACGRGVWPDMRACCHCGADLLLPVWEEAREPVAAGGTAVTMAPSTLPVRIAYNAHKIYFENEMGFLHLMVHNPNSHEIDNLAMTIKGGTLEKPLEGQWPDPLAPGHTISLRISGLLPLRCGEDALDMAISGNRAGEEVFYLKGNIPIRILQRSKTTPNISIDITAPEIGDQNVSLPNMRHTDVEMDIHRVEYWTPVELSVDRQKQVMEERYFPKNGIGALDTRIDGGTIRAMQAMSPEAAPVAAVSTQDGKVYFIVPGNTLLMGRDIRHNHVPLLLYPDRDHHYINRTVSRIHCRIFVRNKRVYIRDTSKTGVNIGSRPIAKYQNVMLPSGATLLFKNQLELEVRIVTDGEDVVAVLVKRLNNESRHTYILAHGPLPVGMGPDLSLGDPGGTRILGFVYYRPHSKSWSFLKYGEPSDEKGDRQLKALASLECGQQKLWFSPAR